MVEVQVLGPVRVLSDGQPVAIGGPRERGVVAALALAGAAGGDTDRLVDLVWGEAAPPSAVRTLQAYLSRIRHAVGSDVVESAGGRHRLTAEVDLWRFEGLRRHAREVPADAAIDLDRAVGLWRGQVPAAGATLEGAGVELAAIARDRLDATEELLAHVDDRRVVEVAEKLLREEPHREGVWAALATALYRLGRQADALTALRDAREFLGAELGVDPSPELRRLEVDLLRHDITPEGGVALPEPVAPLVGRDALCADVADALTQRRLVSLIGVGGVGKTRLAFAAAAHFARRAGVPVFFAALAGATTTRAVETTLVAAVGADADTDDVVGALSARFARGRGLVVVDNCEHVVVPLADLLTRVLARCPRLQVLATTRTPLGVSGEVLIEVPPLTTTEAGEEEPAGALRLFLERAADVVDTSAWTPDQLREAAAISAALDGIPLAIEVAARRTRSMSLAELRMALTSEPAEPRPGRLAVTAPLAAALDTSFDALPPEAQRGFGRLSVLRGPVAFETAAEIAGGAEILDAIVDVSLLQPAGEQVRMYEPVRQYAAQRLTAANREAAQRDAAYAVLRDTEKAAQHFFGSRDAAMIDRVDAMHADVRAALEWARAHGDHDVLARMAAAVGFLWTITWGAREGEHWLAEAAAVEAPLAVRVGVLTWASIVAGRRGDTSSARRLGAEAVSVARELGDPAALGAALHAAAQPEKYGDGTEKARAMLREAADLRLAAGDLSGSAMSLGAIADSYLNEGRLDEAAAGYERGLPLMRRSGSARGLLAYLHSMAETELFRGNLDAASEYATEAQRLVKQTHDIWHGALVATVQAACARDAGQGLDELLRLTRAALLAAMAQSDPTVLHDAVDVVAGLLLERGDADDALHLLRTSQMIRERDGVPVSQLRRRRRDMDEQRALAMANESAMSDVPASTEWMMAAALDAVS